MAPQAARKGPISDADMLKTPRKPAPPPNALKPRAGTGGSLFSWVAPLALSAIGVSAAFYNWSDFVRLIAYLEPLALGIKPGLPRFSVLDFLGSVIVCDAYRAAASFPRGTLEALVACTLIQFGGTTLAHLCILGQAPSWLMSFTAWPALAAAFWFTFCCPGDLWHRVFSGVPPLRLLVFVGCWVSCAHAVTSWGLDKAVIADHKRAADSMLCAILCGTISACGGGILCDLLGLYDPEMGVRRTPKTLRQPGLPLQRAFACAVLYYALTDPHGYLAPAAAAALKLAGQAAAGMAALAAAAAARAAAADGAVAGLSGAMETAAAAGEQAAGWLGEYSEQQPSDGLVLGVWREDKASARAAVAVVICFVNTIAYFKPKADVLYLAYLPLRLLGVPSSIRKKDKLSAAPAATAATAAASTPNPKGRKAD